MADLSATTKIETLMITVCWTEFHINAETDGKNSFRSGKIYNRACLFFN